MKSTAVWKPYRELEGNPIGISRDAVSEIAPQLEHFTLPGFLNVALNDLQRIAEMFDARCENARERRGVLPTVRHRFLHVIAPAGELLPQSGEKGRRDDVSPAQRDQSFDENRHRNERAQADRNHHHAALGHEVPDGVNLGPACSIRGRFHRAGAVRRSRTGRLRNGE